MLTFSKVPRGVKQWSRIKTATQFCVLSGKTCHEREKMDKFIYDYIFMIYFPRQLPDIRVGFKLLECDCRIPPVSFRGGLGWLGIWTFDSS